ncbi:hypothetical protein E2562_024078 [Oryza meyeriana var. granulata]|uniref:Uncharacterized protein n=1 Tax=Oryza meyeriana var. granulata TaxID=110450 RepID=A0A6G1CJ24_9ORYZ|nr:hypothetical protein E2562_024078 [Oryza meyeriana var. granulata]
MSKRFNPAQDDQADSIPGSQHGTVQIRVRASDETVRYARLPTGIRQQPYLQAAGWTMAARAYLSHGMFQEPIDEEKWIDAQAPTWNR